MTKQQRDYPLLLCLLAAFVFLSAGAQLRSLPRQSLQIEMRVALPRAVQVLMSAGDRYLAANLAGFRALVASTETMTRDNYRIQGHVQMDAAWLNPAHEDNYYIAAAILPWNDELAAAQYVLRRAALARPFDWQPAFYFAFNELTFNKAPLTAAEWLKRSADAAEDEMQKLQLLQLGAQWATKSGDPLLAIRLHRAMASETRYRAFAAFLEKRADRLEILMHLNRAASEYVARVGKKPSTPADLVNAGFLERVPPDPFGASYAIAADGRVVIAVVGQR